MYLGLGIHYIPWLAIEASHASKSHTIVVEFVLALDGVFARVLHAARVIADADTLAAAALQFKPFFARARACPLVKKRLAAWGAVGVWHAWKRFAEVNRLARVSVFL